MTRSPALPACLSPIPIFFSQGSLSYDLNQHLLDDALNKYSQVNLTGRRVLIWGSTEPWLEAMALHRKAKEIVTVDYIRIKNYHEKAILTL